MNGGKHSNLLGFVLSTAIVCLALGLTMPIVRLTRFYIWSDVHSLLSIVWELYLRQEVFLAAVIFIFSVAFPSLKLLYLVAVYTGHGALSDRHMRWLRRVSWLGKWSMLDVLVLALVVFYVKTTTLADAISMPGIYLFAAAVVLTMIAHSMIQREAQR